MRFAHRIIFSRAFRTSLRYHNLVKQLQPAIKVINTKENEYIRVSFKYSNSPNLLVKAPKDQDVQMVLNRIKLMAALQRKKEEIRQTVANRFTATADGVVETVEEVVDVCLLQNDELIDENSSNADAWSRASTLKIGDCFYDVQYNVPTVTELSLSEFLVSGCPIRPHFILECASFKESSFVWFRSVPVNNFPETYTDEDTRISLIQNESSWEKVKEGFIYYTTAEDVGCYLKVVCTPKQGNETGFDYSFVSKGVVEAWPEMFPFEERHAFAKEICDKDSIRCLTYNILANTYVERRRFPYATKKARDPYYRKQLLLRELMGYNSDIICLQEVQERVFEYDLLEVLKEVGFQGVYVKKGGRRYEGLATFFRSSKFRILKNYGVILNEIVKDKEIFVDLLNKVAGNLKDMSKLLAQDTALQVTLLEDISKPQRKVLTANTHLYSNKDSPEVRLIQAALCAYFVEHIIKTENLVSNGILFCGDFNSLPSSTAYNFLKSGSFECCPTWKNNSTTNVDAILRHSLDLDSACGTPEYTNYTEEFKGCLDYIFYSKKYLKVTDIVPMPSHDLVTAHVGLPNECFPSDHLALVCTVKWLENS